MFRVSLQSRCILLAGLLFFGAPAFAADIPVKQVLVLQSFDRGNLILDDFSTNFRVDLVQGFGAPVNIVQVTVGATGFVGAPEESIVEYIRSIYANSRHPDLIVTVAASAALFARKYHSQLFPDTPLMFATVDQRFVGNAPLSDNEAAVTVAQDFSGLIDDILQVLPQTKHVFMVMGSGPLAPIWRPELDRQFRRFQGRVTFTWSGDRSLSEMLEHCAKLPKDSAIYYFVFGTDASGVAYADERVLAALRNSANAPLFAVQSVYLGNGVVGGRLLSIDTLARNASETAVRLLKGGSPRDLRLPPLRVGRPTYDWRELQRWEIPESRLPPDSDVRYRDPGLWDEYRTHALAAAGALAIQAFLIFWLLYEYRARHRAEVESRRNLALAADASRRETMAALTNSIAHELSQPITSMMCNAEVLQAMMANHSANEKEVDEILGDIRAEGALATQIIDRHRKLLRSRELSVMPLDLAAVIKESLTLVAHEMKSRQIEVSVDLSSSPCIVSGDHVLMQQAVVNLVMNAMDAMAKTPELQRLLTIQSQVRSDVVEVSIRDTGEGLSPEIISVLFKPFVTTKPQGLGIGLTIVRTILDAHGGTIKAQNNPDGGATFAFRLPCVKPAKSIVQTEEGALPLLGTNSGRPA